VELLRGVAAVSDAENEPQASPTLRSMVRDALDQAVDELAFDHTPSDYQLDWMTSCVVAAVEENLGGRLNMKVRPNQSLPS
jgi:hypothetical protein